MVLWFIQKSFYTRETLRSIKNLWLAKIPTLIEIGWDPWIKKSVNHLSCIEGKGDIHCSAQNAALFVDLS